MTKGFHMQPLPRGEKAAGGTLLSLAIRRFRFPYAEKKSNLSFGSFPAVFPEKSWK